MNENHVEQGAWKPCKKCSTKCTFCLWEKSQKCETCKDGSSYKPFYNFCPHCGRPLMPKA